MKDHLISPAAHLTPLFTFLAFKKIQDIGLAPHHFYEMALITSYVLQVERP